MKKSALIRTALFSALLFSTSVAQCASEIKIGFLTTLSGAGATAGADIRDGFSLGIKLNGDKLGGLPVNMSIINDQQNPQIARQAIDRFIKQDKVDLITGMVFSNVLLPVVPSILQSGIVYLSTNTGPATYAGAKCDQNFFAVAWENEDIPQAMGKFATSQGFTRVAMIAPNYPGGRESIGGFKRQYKGEVVDEIYTKLNQLDYSAELTTLRAAKPQAVFFFLPGGMGVNFIKQFHAAGLSKQITLLAPGFSGDVDTIEAVGDPIVGLYNAAQWAADLPNAANQKFVAEFEKAYGRTPTMYASQGYDTALLINSAVRVVNGKIEDHDAFLAAIRKADFDSVRGPFRFNNNQYPIHNIYMRLVEKDSSGKIANKLVGTVLTEHSDPFAGECPLK